MSVRFEKGEETLRKSHISLDLAKKEAISTLSPLLQRMKRSRLIKNTQKVVKRMSQSTLNHSYRIRLALERGDYEDVVSLYQQLQSSQAMHTSRILQQGKEEAEGLVQELLQRCTRLLFSPNTQYLSLLRHGKVILELQGNTQYIDTMRHCLVKQAVHFLDLLQKLRETFVAECVEAYRTGQDIDTLIESVRHTESAANANKDFSPYRPNSAHFDVRMHKFGDLPKEQQQYFGQPHKVKELIVSVEKIARRRNSGLPPGNSATTSSAQQGSGAPNMGLSSLPPNALTSSSAAQAHAQQQLGMNGSMGMPTIHERTVVSTSVRILRQQLIIHSQQHNHNLNHGHRPQGTRDIRSSSLASNSGGSGEHPESHTRKSGRTAASQ